MPIRVALIWFGLFAGCIAVVLIAWASGSEFFMLIPGRYTRGCFKPLEPVGMLALLALCGGMYLYSQRYALIFLTVLLGGLVLGTLVGCGVFAWKPTVSQFALIAAMFVEMSYGWSIREDYLDD
jgi:hypothetical protein